MLKPGISAPFAKGGMPVCSYECGGYRAILVKDPESFGPVRYPHFLIVYKAVDNTPPIMYITAEISTLTSTLTDMLPDDMKAKLGNSSENEVFLGVFDEQGHQNFGSAEEVGDLDKFEGLALAVMKRVLNLTAPLDVLNDTRKGGKFAGNGCLGVIGVFSLVSFIIFEAFRFLT